jgi:hypothetical protein
MRDEPRDWVVTDDEDFSPDAVGRRPDSASHDLLASNARYSPTTEEDFGDSGADVPRPEDGSGAGAPLREEVSVSDSQGTQIGDGNVQFNFFPERLERDAPPRSVYSSPESPEAAAGPHQQPGPELPTGVEIIVRRRFAMDWENGRPCLVGAQAIVANNSTADIFVTKVGLKPAGFPGPSKLVSGNAPEKVEPGGALTCALEAVDFSDILDQVSVSKRPGEPVFLVYAETGYGSAVKAHRSEPFSMTPKSTRPLSDGFTEWTE